MPSSVPDPVTAYATAVTSGQVVAGPWVRLAGQRHLADLADGHARGLRFDAAAAADAIAFFETMLHLPDGRPFALQPWQAFIVGSLFGWYGADGTRRFRTAYIECGKGNGKALALDTPIPTPAGWTTMGQIRTGDVVFDERGQPCTVVGAFNVMHDHPCYEVVFDDHSTIVADADHLWYTEMRWSGRSSPGDTLRGVPLVERGAWRHGLRTTDQIAATLRYRNGQYQSANHSIPLAGALDLPDADLPVDPYALGVWLGDGDSDTARVTVSDADAEILLHLAGVGVEVGVRQTVGDRAPRYTIGSVGRRGPAGKASMGGRLRALGLLGHKHISEAYQRASIAQRLALLQGLMDTDGSIAEATGECEYTSVNQRLAEDVFELVCSMGIKCTASQGRATLNGKDCGSKWRVVFFPPPDVPVFRLARKRARQRFRHARRRLSGDRRIVECLPVPSVPVRCIAVDSPSHLYLAGRAMIPTHNTPLAAGLGLVALIVDAAAEPAAEIYSAATSSAQAGICFRDAKLMAAASPALARRLTIGEHNLSNDRHESYFRAVSSEHRGLDGKRVQMAIVDELHEHPNGLVVQKMRAGVKGRRNALIVEITNAGYDRESVCWQHHMHSISVVEGRADNDAWFSYVCALDEQDDWRDESVWLKANPNLGVSIQPTYLREQVKDATNLPAQESLVRRLNFCQWTESSSRFLPADLWDAGAGPVDWRDMAAHCRGRRCVGGLDLASTSDLAALVLLFRDDSGDEVAYDVLPFAWCPEDSVRERSRSSGVPYSTWVRDGALIATDGSVIDYRSILRRLTEATEAYTVTELGYDRWGSTKLLQDLEEVGFSGDAKARDRKLTPLGQGFQTLSEPTKTLEVLTKTSRLRHGNHPVLRWAIGNLVVVQDAAGNLKPSKEKASEKIDPCVALIMALAIAADDDGTAGWSVYEARPLLVL